MDKLKYVKLENPDGSYSESIPLAVDGNYVDINGSPLITELNKKADEIEVNTNISKLQGQIANLVDGNPLVASSVSGMTDTTRIYVNTTDENWYYYNGSNWIVGGSYLSSESKILNGSILPTKIWSGKQTEESYLLSELNFNHYYNQYGIAASSSWCCLNSLIPVKPGDEVYLNLAVADAFVLYDKNESYLRMESTHQTAKQRQSYTLIVPSNCYYVMVNIYSDFINEAIIKVNNIDIYKKYYYSFLDIGTINPSQLDGAQTNPSSLKDNLIIRGGYRTSEGNIAESSKWGYTDFISVRKNDVAYTPTGRGLVLISYDDNYNVIDSVNATSTAQDWEIEYIVSNDNVKYITFNIMLNCYDEFKAYINDISIFNKTTLSWLSVNKSNLNFNINTITSNWQNKKAVQFGDSIVEAYHDTPRYKGYIGRLVELLNLSEGSNQGVSGRPMADGTPNGVGTVTTITNFADLDQYDLILIASGTNDFKLNVPLGTKGIIGDVNFDRETFYGAYRYAIEHILTTKPTVRLNLWTPLQRDNAGYDVNYTNSAGHKLIDYVNAIKELGEMYSIPVLDLYSNSGVTKKTLSTYTVDGLHLNKNGYDNVTLYASRFINNL